MRSTPWNQSPYRQAFLAVATVAGVVSSASAAEWQPKTAPLSTLWTNDVSPDNVHPEYPRPQLVREHWLNLNGLWDYAIVAKDGAKPATWDGQILVPFPIESALSGVMQTVGPEKKLWYRRSFTIPKDAAWKEKTVLLHFGAVDWDTTVWVNGKEVVKHRGGYDPFSADITAHLKADGDNELLVSVFDSSDVGYQPRGKQVQNPHGIWYTPTTGIWQTVWLEPVPDYRVERFSVRTDIDTDMAEVLVDTIGSTNKARSLSITVRDGKDIKWSGGTKHDPESNPSSVQKKRGTDALKATGYNKRWSPTSPFLYEVEIVLKENDHIVDRVTSYFAMRKISVGKDDKGVTRILLNNKPLFQYGTLDQGFWPDGLYTAPTDAAMKYDIEITKRYGFNMIRKHVKVEPARWYHYCDQLGMLVWQDMPSGDKNASWDPFGKHDRTELKRTEESALNFREEWKHIIDSRRHFPSIVMWVPFNEGWGQADTVAVTKWTKEYDPTRLVNCASGGNDFPVGDVVDVHRYPGPFAPKPEENRAAVLGEYGGLGLPLKGHTWQGEKNWGYRSFTTQEALTEAYLDLLDKLQPMIDRDGLSAAIYTQTTDVEIEVNGLLTYDRQIAKLPVKTLAEAHKALWQPAIKTKTETVLPTAETVQADWQYVIEKPAEGWFQADFDAAGWKTGPSGFGEPSTPGSKVHTNWKSPDIWLRREFTLSELPKGELRVRLHHDEDTEVYLNGVLLKKMTGYSTDYQSYRVTTEGAKALKTGRNMLAVHCHQTGGGQYIDVGLEAITTLP
ncbi:MAG: glycoside hydrolase family 2 TIM barrel-domain containing protein [Planctomycetaceae bacterium]|nr:glycoside hydrolase family 2 TIM barrel-domain containing protein [Planctomycetaceae bacterium]